MHKEWLENPYTKNLLKKLDDDYELLKDTWAIDGYATEEDEYKAKGATANILDIKDYILQENELNDTVIPFRS